MLISRLAAVLAAASLPAVALAQSQDADELAKKLSNPVAALISVPLQYNYDETYGDNGYRHTLNIQPVAPFSISEHWNVISRTILPVIYQDDVVPAPTRPGWAISPRASSSRRSKPRPVA